jgi:hypothetical protein
LETSCMRNHRAFGAVQSNSSRRISNCAVRCRLLPFYR